MRTVLAAILAVTVGAQDVPEKPPEQPNFVIVLADDLGYGDLGCYGAPWKTPHLDALSNEGLRFTDFHSNGAVCSPTRAALLTGRYQQRAGIPGVIFADPARPTHRHGIRDVETTLPESLHAAGYATAAFGKWHLGYLGPFNPTRHGFDQFVGFVSGNVDYQAHLDQVGTADWWHGTKLQPEPGYITHLITQHAVRFIEETRKPFLLYVAHGAPHYPYQGPDDRAVRTEGSRKRLWNDRAKGHAKKTYPAMIRALDESVGSIVSALEKTGRTRNTLFFFMSDNGPAGPGRTGGLRGRKGQVWEGGHRVPAIARWPGRIRAGTTDSLAATMDVMPTILSLASAKVSKKRPLDGIDLSSHLVSDKPPLPRTLFFEHGRQQAVRRGPWKLVRRAPGQRDTGLFDLSSDRDEKRNIAAAHPEKVAELTSALDAWKDDVRTGATVQDVRKKPVQAPPNILLIMADDLGPEWIGCCGGDSKTPAIDAIAKRGMRFRNAYSMPKCTPTRVTLLTGQYPFRHGWVNHWDVPRWGAGCHFDPKHAVTFARLMRDAGYRTAIAGKWQINDFRVQPDILSAHGFEDWCMWTGGEGGNPRSDKRYADPYVHTRTGSRTRKGAFGPDVYTDFLMDFMKQHRDEPMLLYFPMALTHGPLVPTPLDPEAKGKIGRHRAMVRYTDHLVGRLVNTLNELDLTQRTLVIFTTDNGTSRGITGTLRGRAVRGGKGQLSESGCRMPFLASWPGRVPQGTVSDALTDFTDLFPTFLHLAGIALPKGLALDGHSIVPVLTGGQDSARSWVLSMGGGVARQEGGRVVPARPRADRIVRGKRFKLWMIDGKPARLYDLGRDPFETTDVFSSGDPVVTAARERLTRIAEGFPGRDAPPRYDPLPPQPWDRKPRPPERP